MTRRRGIGTIAFAGVVALITAVVQGTSLALPTWIAVALLLFAVLLAGFGFYQMVSETRVGGPGKGEAMVTEMPETWQSVGVGDRFRIVELPQLGAYSLNDSPAFAIYAEWDTGVETEALVEFLKDPLRILHVEGVLEATQGAKPRISLTFTKVPGTEPDPNADALRERAAQAVALYREDGSEPESPGRSDYRITTTIFNHEQPLNFRVVTMNAIVGI
ncbi:MAG TPA: hypothetical protein VK960_11065 [Acidimicrobiia bacterium]|nr:hypothetical protein [Acidimicrobiia bacterium]